ncbi:sigma 54-interacting transcriptional regulator [Oscillospiraceae bacterium 44-5]
MKHKIAIVMRLPYQCHNISNILQRYGYRYPVLCIGAEEEFAEEVGKRLAELDIHIVITGRHFPEKLAEDRQILLTHFSRSRLTFRRSIDLALEKYECIALVLRTGNYFDVAHEVSVSYGNRVLTYSFAHTEEIPGIIDDALTKGAKAFVGNASLFAITTDRHLPAYDIPFEDDDVLNAVHNAEQNVKIWEQQIRNNELILAAWNSVPFGILALDESGLIISANDKVLPLLHCERETLIEQNYRDTALYKLDVELYLRSAVQGSEVVELQGTEVVASYHPIVIEEQLQLLVISLEPVQQVQKNEEKIRRKQHNNGNVATTYFTDIVGNSTLLQQTLQDAKLYARTDSSVLIHGETGTGKEMFAQSIHNASQRANSPFVAINCSALPESLLESILFGYEKGSFTGASQSGKKGLFEAAHTGTIFLDEIGEMPLLMQARFLRVLQEREFTPVGSTKVIPIDIRVIAATNRNLGEMVAEGKFRADLYYRINVLSIQLPPLRERPGDIRTLAEYFILRHRQSLAPQVNSIDSEAIKFLCGLPLEGNTRQLFNLLERAMILSDRTNIDEALIRRAYGQAVPFSVPKRPVWFYRNRNCENMAEEIRAALAACGGSHKLAAQQLGISDSTLYRRIRALGLDV